MSSSEIPLTGGNMSGSVVRVGDTVRRPAGPWTPAVHALLDHLHAAGFEGAPRALGFDEQGREVLTFIPGPVAWPDHFDQLDDDAALSRVARLIREFHDAVASFVPPAGARWQLLMPADGAEIIAHQDLAPWNLVLGGPQWAFIDWDTAAPGTRLWDLAYAMHGFAPLSANPAYQRADAGRRLRLIADGYGLTEAQRHAVIPPHPGHARLPGGPGRAGHRAVGQPVAGRSRRRLGGRHPVHHRAPRAVGAGAARLIRRPPSRPGRLPGRARPPSGPA